MSGTFDAFALANEVTRTLHTYDPGHDLPALRRKYGTDLLELGSNENPFGLSPRVVAAIAATLPGLWRYPDPKGGDLKMALAAKFSVDAAQIALGNGSHELLMLLGQCFADVSTSVLFSQYGFAVFAIAVAATGARPIRVAALLPDHPTAPFGHNLDAFAAAILPDTRLIYLANPNNPTGTWFDDAALEAFLESVPPKVLVVIDEAYNEYVDVPGLTTALRFLPRYPNLVVTRTFSKAYALAGLRIGYVLAHASTIAVIERLRESFNVNHVALAAAEAALSDDERLRRICLLTRCERAWLAERLQGRGWRVLPSQTNFLLVDFGCDAGEIEAQLFRHSVVVRPMVGYGLPTCLRISVGTRVENERLLAALV